MIYNGTNAIVYFPKKIYTISFKELIEMTQENLLKYILRIAHSVVTRRRIWIAELNLGWKTDRSLHFGG